MDIVVYYYAKLEANWDNLDITLESLNFQWFETSLLKKQKFQILKVYILYTYKYIWLILVYNILDNFKWVLSNHFCMICSHFMYQVKKFQWSTLPSRRNDQKLGAKKNQTKITM